MTNGRKIDKPRGDRIKYVRKEVLKLQSQEELAKLMSRELGRPITRGAIGNWELGKEAGFTNLIALAKAADVSVEWLMTGNGSADPPQRSYSGTTERSEGRAAQPEIFPSAQAFTTGTVVGTVEAGSFRFVDEYDQSEPDEVLVPVDPRFPQARVLVFNVSGDSMNALQPAPLRAGMQAVCVAYEDIAHLYPMRDGMVVVVERRRDGGHLREWSIKQVVLEDDRIEFWPRSTNAAHKPIIVPRDSLADDGSEVEVIALVRSAISTFND